MSVAFSLAVTAQEATEFERLLQNNIETVEQKVATAPRAGMPEIKPQPMSTAPLATKSSTSAKSKEADKTDRSNGWVAVEPEDSSPSEKSVNSDKTAKAGEMAKPEKLGSVVGVVKESGSQSPTASTNTPSPWESLSAAPSAVDSQLKSRNAEQENTSVSTSTTPVVRSPFESVGKAPESGQIMPTPAKNAQKVAAKADPKPESADKTTEKPGESQKSPNTKDAENKDAAKTDAKNIVKKPAEKEQEKVSESKSETAAAPGERKELQWQSAKKSADEPAPQKKKTKDAEDAEDAKNAKKAKEAAPEQSQSEVAAAPEKSDTDKATDADEKKTAQTPVKEEKKAESPSTESTTADKNADRKTETQPAVEEEAPEEPAPLNTSLIVVEESPKKPADSKTTPPDAQDSEAVGEARTLKNTDEEKISPQQAYETQLARSRANVIGTGGPVDASKVGDPHAATKVKLLVNEIANGLKTRNMTGRMGMWQGYARSTLRSTNSINTNSEIDARCRLSWYVELFSDVINSIPKAEEFSRSMHHALIGDHTRFAQALAMIRQKLDIPARNDDGIQFSEIRTPQCAVDEIVRAVTEAQVGMSKALSTLTIAEQAELNKNLYQTFSGSGCVNGHTIPNRSVGRRLCALMDKMDRTGVHQAAEALAPLVNRELLDKLATLPENAYEQVMISGQRMQRVATPAGDILIGGRDSNVYDLDSSDFKDVVCLIDLGGNDVYKEGTCGLHRPVFVLVDVGPGNDTYAGSKPGIQGGSILGVSMLINVEGDTIYNASDVAQGSTLGGAGMLFDFGGNDSYKALRRAQGHALCGVGILNDKGGNDKFRAALWAQGFGAPGGFGILENVEGNDFYYCGGLYIDSYPEHPGYDGWGQGVGAGIRQVANGGIGMILDGAGDDKYEVDYFGHGGGYWLGIGIARDFGGNDVRAGTTNLAYNEQPRRETKWTRFCHGYGCHYACGYLFDDDGDDFYGGTIMGTGMAWDLSMGVLCDFKGNNTYSATGGMTQGVGAEGSIGILFNYGGNQKHLGRNQGYAGSGITYHSASNCGANFSFLVNYGGKNEYGSGARGPCYLQRGSGGGFLIDRPLESEVEADRIARAKSEKERVAKEAAEAEAREKSVAEIKQLLADKKPLTQQQRQTWYRYQRQQQIQEQQSRRAQQRPQPQNIESVPTLGKVGNKTVK